MTERRDAMDEMMTWLEGVLAGQEALVQKVAESPLTDRDSLTQMRLQVTDSYGQLRLARDLELIANEIRSEVAARWVAWPGYREAWRP